MKRIFTSLLILSVFLPSILTAQNFAVLYEFSGVNNTTGRVDPSPVPTANGLTFGSFAAVGNSGTNSGATGRFSFSGWPTGATNNSNSFSGAINTSQYYEVMITPQTNYSVSLDSITFLLQRSGTGIRQYSIRSSADGFAANLPAVIDPANANLSIVAGNTFQVSDGTTVAETGSKVVLNTIPELQSASTPIILRFYGWNAEGNSGTFSIDNVAIWGKAELSATAAEIITSTSSITFPSTIINQSAQVKTYIVRGNNLSGPLNITTAAPYSISEDNINFNNSLNFSAAEIATDKTIYVKFTPSSTGTINGSITHSSSGTGSKVVSLSGEGIDAANLVFNFNNCTNSGAPGNGFNGYSVTGNQVWSCTNFGYSGTKGAEMNGYASGVIDNEDWFISPPLLLSSLNLPVLKFYSKNEFTGPLLQLLVSTDYDGSSNPNNATWTELNGNLPLANNTWTLSDGIDLTTYKNAPQVFIAFKYSSSNELGAARWTLDDIEINNRTQLVSTSPVLLNLGEATQGTNSAGLPFNVKVVGFGDVTVSVPAPFAISTDSINYSSSVIIPAASAANGTRLFARFSPAGKFLKIEGNIKITATGLDTNTIMVSGTSYPRAETFDAGTYNLSFFGSNPTNNATQQKINTQVNNVAIVFNRLKQDVTGIQEVSNDVALDSLVKKIPNSKAVLSHRYSLSYNGPDPNFPPQKIGFIYDTLVMKLVEARVLFEKFYDSARSGFPNLLPGYPTSPSGFWASGRLPFMATFDATIDNVTRRIRIIVIHAKSATDASSYNRRVYDAKVLKDTLDAFYKNDNVLIVGDYNDRLFGTNYGGSSSSSYKRFIDDSANYTGLTLPLDKAGKTSYINGAAMIDHLIVSNNNNLRNDYIQNSVEIEDPRNYLSGYSATSASDHLPVSARFSFVHVLPITLTRFNAQVNNKQVVINWATANEVNTKHFTIERSLNQTDFYSLEQVKAAGNSQALKQYVSIDKNPLTGFSFYRLKQTDNDGQFKYSKIERVNFSPFQNKLTVYPNPVNNNIQLILPASSLQFMARVIDVNGKNILVSKGTISSINLQVNSQIYKWQPGIYFIKLDSGIEHYTATFIKQ